MNFFDRLQKRVDEIDSLLCIGLDPHCADLGSNNTAEGAYDFCKRLIDATIPYASAYKPNVAFFEALGWKGVQVLEKLISEIPNDIPVLLDCKRGDISTTADAYAVSAFEQYKASAVTINGYMGVDSIAPFTKDPSKGVFVLCKTSNPSSSEVQSLALGPASGGSLVFEQVAKLATGPWNGNHNVGLVVGATDIDALAAVRSISASVWILAPGIGFQGGDAAKVMKAALRSDGSGVLVPVSRAISRAADPGAAAKDLQVQLSSLRSQIRTEKAAIAEKGAKQSISNEQLSFIQTALSSAVLKFGSFVLKSGRVSPYFFNAGKFNDGNSISVIGKAYASAIARSKIEFDVLFGPAYKGIPLVTCTAMALSVYHGINAPLSYNRKEAKEHGEGGLLVGASISGKRVFIIDDVISAGTAINESVQIIKAEGGTPVGVVVGLDREEKGTSTTGHVSESLSATQQVMETHKIPVLAVVTLTNLITYIVQLMEKGETVPGLENMTTEFLLEKVHEYNTMYGVNH
jgi:uridine monophosphate synthetase